MQGEEKSGGYLPNRREKYLEEEANGSLEKRLLRGDLLLQLPDRRVQPGGGQLCSQRTRDKSRRNSLKLQQGIFRLDIGKNFFPERIFQAAQGSGGVTIFESIQKPRQCGTWGHGLVVDLSVLGEWLDLMSSPFCDSHTIITASHTFANGLFGKRCWENTKPHNHQMPKRGMETKVISLITDLITFLNSFVIS